MKVVEKTMAGRGGDEVVVGTGEKKRREWKKKKKKLSLWRGKTNLTWGTAVQLFMPYL